MDDKKFVCKVLLMSLFISAFCLGGILYVPLTSTNTVYADEKESVSVTAQPGEYDLKVPLPSGFDTDHVVIESYTDKKQIRIIIENIDKNYLYENDIVQSSSHIEKMVYDYADDAAIIDLHLDGYFECECSFDDEGDCAGITLIALRDKYERVVVIDAGHGASDPGTAVDDAVESEIDLRLALLLKDKLNEKGIGVCLTRSGSDENPAGEVRHAMAAEAGADAYVSIHCNGDPRTRTSFGSVVRYSDKGNELAQCIAKHAADNDEQCLDNEHGGVLPEGDIPAVMYLPGYLTNKADADRLMDDDKLAETADKLCEGLEEYFDNDR